MKDIMVTEEVFLWTHTDEHGETVELSHLEGMPFITIGQEGVNLDKEALDRLYSAIGKFRSEQEIWR